MKIGDGALKRSLQRTNMGSVGICVVGFIWGRRNLLASLVALFPAAVAFAQDCSKPPTRMFAEQCAAASYERTDAELNATYKAIQSRLENDPEATAHLLIAQRNWIAFRDAECMFQSEKDLGGLRRLTLNTCLDQLTQQRSAQLSLYLNCEDGDVGCPVLPGD